MGVKEPALLMRGARSETNRRRGLAAVASLLALVFVLTACGGGDDTAKQEPSTGASTGSLADGVTGPERAPVLAVQEYATARSTGDGRTICGLTSVDDKALASCLNQIGAGLPPTPLEYELKDVSLSDPNDATVLLTQTKPKQPKGTPPTKFIMRRVGGEWKAITVSIPAS